MESAIKAFEDFAKEAIHKGYEPDNCLNYLYSLNDNFKNDAAANNIFPTVFGIEFCKHKMSITNDTVN